MRLVLILMALCGVLLHGATALAAEFLFGEETKGITFTSNDSSLRIRLKLQPRFDYGDIIESEDGRTYETDGDLYIRRVRLEFTGDLLKEKIGYELVLRGDKWEKTGQAEKVEVYYANVVWRAHPAANIMVGKRKLPYSRVSLTSSGKQLLVERPSSTEEAKDVFGASSPYHQPKLALYGNLIEGVLDYEFALADGWSNGETIQTGRTVHNAGPFLGLRIEASPPGWYEGGKSDAHLGEGQHMTFGFNFALQDDIEYAENASSEERSLWGFDLSGHYGPFTAQVEYIAWEIDSDEAAIGRVSPRGWYFQGGYFIEGVNIEPVLRYEVFDQDSERSDMEERNTTLGVNWYGKGHSLKLGANWVHTEFDSNATGKLPDDDDKDVYQLQAQLWF